MLNLAEYRRRADRLADHLPWAALVAPGVVLNKHGSFQRTLRFRGPDLESATEAELISACARANNVLKRFGSGWALFFDAERREAAAYADSDFPDAASWLVDQERRAAFLGEGAHFESRYHLTLVWLPAPDSAEAAGRTLVERPGAGTGRDWRGALAHFIAEYDAVRGLIDLHPTGAPRTSKHNPVVPAIDRFKPILAAWALDGATPVKSFKTRWRTMRRALDLPGDVEAKTIRHTVATRLRTLRVPGEEVETLLGHRTLRKTTAVYAKYDPDYLANVAKGLAVVWDEFIGLAMEWAAGHMRATPKRGQPIRVDKRTLIAQKP